MLASFSHLARTLKFPKWSDLDINIKLRVLTLEDPNKNCFLKNESIYKHINVWSFSLYWSFWHCISTHILLFFLLLSSVFTRSYCVLFKMWNNYDMVCTFLLIQFVPCWPNFMTLYQLCIKRTTFLPSQTLLNASFLVKENHFSVCCYFSRRPPIQNNSLNTDCTVELILDPDSDGGDISDCDQPDSDVYNWHMTRKNSQLHPTLRFTSGVKRRSSQRKLSRLQYRQKSWELQHCFHIHLLPIQFG
jgi:hypothetical protein